MRGADYMGPIPRVSRIARIAGGALGDQRRRPCRLERIENVRDVLSLRVNGVAHDVHVVAAAELERAAGAALLREADQNVAALRIDDLTGEFRARRTGAVAGDVALRARAGREVVDGA